MDRAIDKSRKTHVVCKNGIHYLRYCGQKFKLYRIRRNGELILFPPFDRLWELVAFTGNFHNWFFCGVQQDFALPPSSTTRLTGRKFPGSDFVAFTRTNTNGPITSDGIRLTTFSNSTNLRISWRLISDVTRDPAVQYRCAHDSDDNGGNELMQPNVSCISIGFYTTDVIEPQDPNRMYAMYSRNDIAIFEANERNNFSGEFVAPTLNQLFVNISTDADVRVELVVMVDIPHVDIPCLELNQARVKYLFVNSKCDSEELKIPVYSLVLTDTSTQNVSKTVFPWFRQVTEEIHRVYNRTSLSLLLPIEATPVPEPVTYENVPVRFYLLDSSTFAAATITDSFGPSVYIDWWFLNHWGFKLFSTQTMVPLITFVIRVDVPANPNGVALFFPVVQLLYMTAGSLWHVHTQHDQVTGAPIGPASMVLEGINSGQSRTYPAVSMLLATDSIDVSLDIKLNQATALEQPNPPFIGVSSFTIAYVPNPAIPPA